MPARKKTQTKQTQYKDVKGRNKNRFQKKVLPVYITKPMTFSKNEEKIKKVTKPKNEKNEEKINKEKIKIEVLASLKKEAAGVYDRRENAQAAKFFYHFFYHFFHRNGDEMDKNLKYYLYHSREMNSGDDHYDYLTFSKKDVEEESWMNEKEINEFLAGLKKEAAGVYDRRENAQAAKVFKNPDTMDKNLEMDPDDDHYLAFSEKEEEFDFLKKEEKVEELLAGMTEEKVEELLAGMTGYPKEMKTYPKEMKMRLG